MRLLRHKQNRKTLNYYRIVHGIHTPYRLLVDGNFIVVAERLRMEWKRLVPKLLEVDEEQIHWHITECIIEELRSLGTEYKDMLNIALSLPLLKCRHKHGHTNDMDASSCIQSLTNNNNQGKWLILSQDKELRSILRKIPGIPLLLISNNVLILELPSKASKLYNQTSEIEKTTLRPDELKAVKQAVQSTSSSSSINNQKSTNLTTTTTNNNISKHTGANVPSKKRKKGPSEPNPLSNKRKKVTQQPLSSTSHAHDNTDNETISKKQRRRKHKHNKTNNDTTTSLSSNIHDNDSDDDNNSDNEDE